METEIISEPLAPIEPVKPDAEGEFLIRTSQKGITLPIMGTLAAHYYPAVDGVIHFPASARVHAEYANELFRNEDRAVATLADRKAKTEARVNSMGRLESIVEKSLGGNKDLAATVAATVAGLMPAMMTEMRAQLKAEMEAAPAPAPKGSGKN